MTKKKILIPLDGTDRSMHSIDYLKSLFEKDEVKVTLMNVSEIVIANDMVISNDAITNAQKKSTETLQKGEEQLSGYEVEKYGAFGYAADEILEKAKEDKFDAIIMTRSTKKGFARIVGSVTNKVVKNAENLVMIVPE